MKRNIAAILSALVLALACVFPAPATVRRDKLRVDLTTGANTAFTASTAIYSRRIAFQSSIANTATVYIGDSTLDPTSATTLRNTCLGELAPGGSWTPTISVMLDQNGEEYQLSRFRASGTTGDKVRLIYEQQETP